MPDSGELVDPVWPIARCKDPRFPSMVLTLLARQFGYEAGQGFAHPRYMSGIDHRVGYYVYRANAYITGADGTRHPYESQRAIIDSWPGIDGLHLSVAHVGHGIMSSPAGGEIIAAKVLGLPLSDPVFRQFGLDVPWVEHKIQAGFRRTRRCPRRCDKYVGAGTIRPLHKLPRID